ncbi:MAG: hypothetical protein WCQ47_03695 [bacterium]
MLKNDEIKFDRKALNSYEKEILIPHLKDTLAYYKKTFLRVIEICHELETQSFFQLAIKNLITAGNLPTISPIGNPTKKFVDEIVEMAKSCFIQPIEEMEAKYKNIDSLEQQGRFFTELALLCSSIIETDERLFLVTLPISGSVHVVDPTTGKEVENVIIEPREYRILLHHFKIIRESLLVSATNVQDSIMTWHKEQMKWITKNCDLKIKQKESDNLLAGYKLNRWSFFAGIGLSVLFLVIGLLVSDPFNLYVKNQRLSREYENQVKLNKVLEEKMHEETGKGLKHGV